MSEQLQTITELSELVLQEKWEEAKKYLTDDILYKVGSAEPVYGKESVVGFLSGLFQSTAKLTGHDIRKVWDEPNIVAVEMDAKYIRLEDNKKLTIACCDIYRMRGNQVSEWRVYADMAPFTEDKSKPVTLDPNNSLYTVVVYFTIEPSRQQEVLNTIVDFLENTVKHRPGFVSSTVHRSFDGTRIINYAQWESKEHFEAALPPEIQALAPEIFEEIRPDKNEYDFFHQAVASA